MRLFAAIIFMMNLWIKVSAQDTSRLNLTDELYFHISASGFADEFYRVQATRTPAQVFTTPNRILNYAWTADGTKIALIINDYNKAGIVAEIYSREFEFITQMDVNLFDRDYEQYPVTWTEDGEHLLAVIGKEDGLPYVSRMPLDPASDPVEQVVFVPETEKLAHIYWSPNAQQALYQTLLLSDVENKDSPPQPQLYRLYLLDLATFESTLVTDTSFNNCIAWSSDGNRFASVSDSHRNLDTLLVRANHLQIYDLNAEVVTEVDTRMALDRAIGCAISWSHNGQWIAFRYAIFTEPDEVESGIAVIDMQTHEIRKVGVSKATAYAIESMHWSSDDSWIVIETFYNAFGDVRLFSFDTGEEIILTVGDGVPLFNPQWHHVNE